MTIPVNSSSIWMTTLICVFHLNSEKSPEPAIQAGSGNFYIFYRAKRLGVKALNCLSTQTANITKADGRPNLTRLLFG